ncbi:MAG: hypothetical protein ACKO23_11630 [Gemmataceae bacterium]
MSRHLTNPEGAGFRRHYHEQGPEGYYLAHAGDYRNPHEAAVAACLDYAVDVWASMRDGIQFGKVLDLAAGGGEATRAILRRYPSSQIEAMDPYTNKLYQQRTGRACLPISFEQIAREEHLLGPYGCVICSCALHLVGPSWLPRLCLALARASRDLLVLSPITRPHIRPGWGWRLLQEMAFTCEDHRIRIRWYRREQDEPSVVSTHSGS